MDRKTVSKLKQEGKKKDKTDSLLTWAIPSCEVTLLLKTAIRSPCSAAASSGRWAEARCDARLCRTSLLAEAWPQHHHCSTVSPLRDSLPPLSTSLFHCRADRAVDLIFLEKFPAEREYLVRRSFFQTVDGLRGLLAQWVPQCWQGHSFPVSILAQFFSWAGRSPSSPAASVSLPRWHLHWWHLHSEHL